MGRRDSLARDLGSGIWDLGPGNGGWSGGWRLEGPVLSSSAGHISLPGFSEVSSVFRLHYELWWSASSQPLIYYLPSGKRGHCQGAAVVL
jgi:hypothetical protein